MEDAPLLRRGADDIVAGGRRRRRRRRTLQIGSAGAAAALAVAATMLYASNPVLSGPIYHPDVSGHHRTVVPVAMPPFTFMFNAYAAGKFKVDRPEDVTRTYQQAVIMTAYHDKGGKTEDAVVGSLTVYQPGIEPPAVFTQGTKVTVHGRPGFANKRLQDRVVGIAPVNSMNIMANTLAWQYEPHSWAVINSVIDDPRFVHVRLAAADERALADKFELGRPSHARIPFKASYLPAGWAVVKIDGRSLTSADTVPISVVFAPVSKAAAHTIRHHASDGSAVEISLVRRQNPPPDAPSHKKTCIPNYDPAVDFWCSWDIPHTSYSVVVHDPAMKLSEQELTKIGQGLVFDNFDHPATWHRVS
jgi:hypothetical protein